MTTTTTRSYAARWTRRIRIEPTGSELWPRWSIRSEERGGFRDFGGWVSDGRNYGSVPR